MAAQSPRAPGKPGVNPFLLAGLVSFGSLFELLNSTALSVGLNSIAGSLGATTAESDGVITTYLVANAAALPLSAWAATYLGRKRLFIGCILLFVVASVLCAFAWSIESLILFRALQGAAAAGNAASETSIIADSFPPEKRGQGFAMYGMAVVIGPAFGPLLGGWAVEYASWQWIFWINVPTGLLVAAAFFFLIEDKPPLRRETERAQSRGLKAVDWTGVLLAVLGLVALTLLLDQGQQEDWFASSTIVAATVVAAVCLGALPVWELGRREPILDFRLLANRQLAVSVVLLFVVGVVVLGAASLFPLWLQQSFGFTPLNTGLVLAIAALIAMLPTPLSGILTGKVNTAPLVIGAFSVTAIGFYLVSVAYGDYGFWRLVFAWAVCQCVIAFVFVPLQSHALINVPANSTEQVASFLNIARNLGGAVGTSMGLAAVVRAEQTYREDIVSGSGTFYGDAAAEVARQGGEVALDAAINGQATILAYKWLFFVLFAVALACIPLSLLLKGKPGGEPEANPKAEPGAADVGA